MRMLIQSQEEWARAREHLGHLKVDGEKRYVYECKVYRRPRSTAQNRTLWMWYAIICDEVDGNHGPAAVDALHEFCKSKFLPKRTITVAGEAERVAGSTKMLNTVEFSRYMDEVRQWGENEFGCILPDPSQQGYDRMCAYFGREK